MTSARNLGLTVTGSSGREELVLCPFHSDKTSSAWWNPDKELFYCAVCGIGLNLVQLASRLNVALDEIASNANENIQDYNLMVETPHYDLGEVKYHPYFEKRKIDRQVFYMYGARFKDSIPIAASFPIYDLTNKVVGVQYRYLNPEETGTRYRTFGEVQPVWPMHELKWLVTTKTVIVTEGVFSAMRLSSHLYHNESSTINLIVLATMGAKANSKTLALLNPFKSIFLYDNDNAGRRACKKMRELAPLGHAYVLSTSPDDMNNTQLYELVDKVEKLYAS